jgi:very-short-patch-repair endonuclease
MAYRMTIRMRNRSKTLRKDTTEPEIMLWSRLKTRGQDKPIFRRQYVFGSMIFDFYCPAAKLAVEIDGSSHWDEEKQAKDDARDRWLAIQGIEVMRIGAGWVYRRLGGVVDAVILRAEERMRSR